MNVFLVDGTYELFRHHFGQNPHENRAGREVAATRGVLATILFMIEQGAAHIGVATDHVIESFRNDMWPGYKSSQGVDPNLLQQFPLLEEALDALGILVWPMVELEADDALASAASVASGDAGVNQVFICTPDKDLAQAVQGTRVVQLHRRRRSEGGGEDIVDEAGVQRRFGVRPSSIPDYLALVGDTSDGYPGLPGWGAKSAAAALFQYGHIEDIPDEPGKWTVTVRGSRALAQTLATQRELAYLFRDLATLRVDQSLLTSVDALRWRGPTSDFALICQELDSPGLADRAESLAS